jgi:hypothetical protein
MRYAFPPYDFIIVGVLAFLIGYFIEKIFFKTKGLKEKFFLVPYSMAFLFVSIGFAFIVDDLPLKLYGYSGSGDGVYDPQSQMGPNPQGFTGKAIKFLVQYGLSVFINLVLCAYCLILIIRYFFSLRRRVR